MNIVCRIMVRFLRYTFPLIMINLSLLCIFITSLFYLFASLYVITEPIWMVYLVTVLLCVCASVWTESFVYVQRVCKEIIYV